MVLNYRKILLIIMFFITYSLFGDNKKISLFYEKGDNSTDEECSIIMYIFNCIESENPINECQFYCDYTFEAIPIERRVLLNKNNAFYILHFEEKNMIFDIYDESGKRLSSSSFDLESCSSLDDLNLIKEKIYDQIASDVLLIPDKDVLLNQIKPETKVKNYNQDKKNNHDFPYISLSLSGLSFHLYYDDLNNFSIFPINLSLSFYPFRYMEINLFYNLSYKDFYFDFSSAEMSPFAQFYGMSVGFSFFYKLGHYSLGLSFYNISSFVEYKNTLKSVQSYFLPQFSFYQRLDIKLYKMIYYTMLINFHTVQKFSNIDNEWNGKIFDYDLPQLDVSLLGISVFF